MNCHQTHSVQLAFLRLVLTSKHTLCVQSREEMHYIHRYENKVRHSQTLAIIRVALPNALYRIALHLLLIASRLLERLQIGVTPLFHSFVAVLVVMDHGFCHRFDRNLK